MAPKEKFGQKDTTLAEAYEASKRRRKILLEEPEEEEIENVTINQFEKGKLL